MIKTTEYLCINDLNYNIINSNYVIFKFNKGKWYELEIIDFDDYQVLRRINGKLYNEYILPPFYENFKTKEQLRKDKLSQIQ